MSANEPTGKRGRKVTNDFSRTLTFYNDALELQKKIVSDTFTPFSSVADAQNAHGEKFLDLVNAASKAAFIAEKIKAAQGDGIPDKVLNKFIRPYLELPPYSEMKDAAAKTALLEKIRSNPFMLESIKAAAALAANSEDEDDEE